MNAYGWMAQLAGQARPRSCSLTWHGWAGLQAGGAAGGELSSLMEQVEQAGFTFGAGALGSASACVLGHEEPLLVVHSWKSNKNRRIASNECHN